MRTSGSHLLAPMGVTGCTGVKQCTGACGADRGGRHRQATITAPTPSIPKGRVEGQTQNKRGMFASSYLISSSRCTSPKAT
ncbi:hypothetical protein FA13DRAFT_163228 [Coprinellus micaceus]|uniref:Uncharacterized protein n=1 Tax=Coprinellus micaceus TaxID=71717 RepID=A0A4Y7THG9_COPMI|nr:hypothetical protein FA13DRAFT_163228 [Coprinellus micaceus]